MGPPGPSGGVRLNRRSDVSSRTRIAGRVIRADPCLGGAFEPIVEELPMHRCSGGRIGLSENFEELMGFVKMTRG
jgi:hypothetical protein